MMGLTVVSMSTVTSSNVNGSFTYYLLPSDHIFGTNSECVCVNKYRYLCLHPLLSIQASVYGQFTAVWNISDIGMISDL